MAVRVFALGGLGEVGMNCLAMEQDGAVMLVDCGVTFDHRGLGVDVVHPDFSALEAHRDRLAGLVVTHGHEDHIGAIPYLLQRFDMPVWAPPYALGLLRERAQEHEVLAHARLEATSPREPFRVGPFSVEPIRVTHSIVDATALAIRTSEGTVIHTGDFKFDAAPPDGEAFDEARFRELGDEGVSLLMSDSTNVDALGDNPGEAEVGAALAEAVAGCEGAAIVGIFASNVHRLRMLGDLARRTGRKLVPLGRSVVRHAAIARETGYLAWPSDLVWSANRVRELPRRAILAVATGTQGEPRGALSRLSRDEHPSMRLEAGDTVILSSRAIPGSELEVSAVSTELYRRGVGVVSWGSNRRIHTSGHAHRSEQRRMLELVRPAAFVPVHGTLHHLHRHAQLAREVGVGDALVLENGDVAQLSGGRLSKVDRVKTGRVHTWNGQPLAPSVLGERRALAAEGIASVVLDVRRGVALARISTRGVLDEGRDRRTIAQAERAAQDAFDDARDRDAAAREELVRQAVRRTFFKALGFKPTTLVAIVSDSGR